MELPLPVYFYKALDLHRPEGQEGSEDGLWPALRSDLGDADFEARQRMAWICLGGLCWRVSVHRWTRWGGFDISVAEGPDSNNSSTCKTATSNSFGNITLRVCNYGYWSRNTHTRKGTWDKKLLDSQQFVKIPALSVSRQQRFQLPAKASQMRVVRSLHV
eukprot:1115883-Amphidinium_carterae.1